MKIKVGIVGENPQNDSEALRVLLQPFAKNNVQFKPIAKNFKGGQLDGEKFFDSLKIESREFDWVILSRDLDGVVTETKKITEKDSWFKKANKKASEKGLFFLVVAEMEALILSDIKRVNDFFKTKLSKFDNPKFIPNPKKELENKTSPSSKANKQYKENMTCEIFEKINLETIYKNHKGEYSFQAFIDLLIDKEIIDANKIPLSKKEK